MRVTCADQSDNSSFGTREDAFCGRERAVFDAWDGSRGADARDGGGGEEARTLLAEAALRLLKRSAPSRTARSNASMISGDVLSSIGRFFIRAIASIADARRCVESLAFGDRWPPCSRRTPRGVVWRVTYRESSVSACFALALDWRCVCTRVCA